MSAVMPVDSSMSWKIQGRIYQPVVPEPPSFWKGVGYDTLVAAGVRMEEDGLVWIPYFGRDGTFAYAKKITASGGRWYEPKPNDLDGLVPYGLEGIPNGIRETDIVFICEGESDALTMREHFGSIDNRRIFVLGLPGSSTWTSEWVEHLMPFHAIYVFGDGDEAGRRMARDVLEDIRWALVVELPDGDDVRSFVQREGADALLLLMEEAEEAVLAVEPTPWDLKVAEGFRLCRTLEEMEIWMSEGES